MPATDENQNNRAFLFCLHCGNDGAAEMEYRVHMKIKGSVPFFRSEFQQTAIDRAARGMHEHGDRAEFKFRFLYAATRIGGFSAIGRNDFATSSEFENGVPRAGRLVVHFSSDDRDIGAFACERDGGGGSDSTSSSRNEGNFPGKFHIGGLGVETARRDVNGKFTVLRLVYRERRYFAAGMMRFNFVIHESANGFGGQ